MKALAIDSAVSKLTISAKNDDKFCTTIFNIGMKQSETLLPAIDYVLSKVGITAQELNYMTLSQGPGSFTGLRLAFSALKAIECAFKIPIYGISSLLIHSYPFSTQENSSDSNFFLSCIDANKDRFYANISSKNCELMTDGDYSFEELKNKILEILSNNETQSIMVCGPDRNKFYDLLKKESIDLEKIKLIKYEPCETEILFELAEIAINENRTPLKDFDGPVYLRASEAELVLQSKQNS